METKSLEERVKLSWYEKRSNQNKATSDYLIEKILEHEPVIANKIQLNYLPYEDLFELAIASVNKNTSISLGKGQDFDDGFDAKVCIARTHNYGKNYGGTVRCKTKKACRVLLYENINDKFYFFAIPTEDYKEVSLPFKRPSKADSYIIKSGLEFIPPVKPKLDNKWWQFQVDTFEEMCKVTMEDLYNT